jgi:hypothetical protein
MGDDNVIDAILPTLQRIQSDIAGLKSDVNRRLDETNAQLAAFKDMTEARLNAIEHVLLDVSARAHMASQLERRVTAIETRLDEPPPR